MSAELIRENDTFWAQIVKQLFKPLVKIQQYTKRNGSPKLQLSHKQKTTTKKHKSERELTASVLKKRSKTHKRLKERFLIRRNRTKRAHFRCNHLFQATYNTTENR